MKNIVILIFIGFLTLFTQSVYGQCDSSDTNLDKALIPNVFTPNIDGFNDGFNIKLDCIVSLEKRIYNRWGELLFKSQQINEPWNGRTNSGVKVLEGTYFYIIDVTFYNLGTEMSETYKGSVTLLR